MDTQDSQVARATTLPLTLEKESSSKNKYRTRDRIKIRLTAPLSQLTKHLAHIPIKDMDNWVHRPMEVRRYEVAKRHGKVTKPMNSFFLYRQAYSERAKEWLAQNNQAILSIAFGQSWRMESQEIRSRFEQLASIDKKDCMEVDPRWSVQTVNIMGGQNTILGSTISPGSAESQYSSIMRSSTPERRSGKDSDYTDLSRTVFDSLAPKLLPPPMQVGCRRTCTCENDVDTACYECVNNEAAMLDGMQFGPPSLLETSVKSYSDFISSLCPDCTPGSSTGRGGDYRFLGSSEKPSYEVSEHLQSPALFHGVPLQSQADSCYDPLGLPSIPPSTIHHPMTASQLNMEPPLTEYLQPSEAYASASQGDMEQFDSWINYEAFDV
ncbi:hypothetical protein BDV24DRAFT_170385 [Aspergillus arachidicola]|uniref:HMG box domain-containing protein n=1 Tax=Aspergillus arachidicola TaxID=656916 RepID=A0A5N6XM30_9EURO|nr:hypothetical protein BDV24DRAFT_170385 [Aspergillus arachidicola]